MVTTPHLSIALVEQSQAQKEVTVNEALTRIDSVLGSQFVRNTSNDWRRNPGAVTDSGGAAAAILAAMSAGGNAPCFYVDTATTRILTFDIPAFLNDGMAVWEMGADNTTTWTITYEESFNSGASWSTPAAVSTIQPSPNRIVRLQKHQIQAGAARRMRLTFAHDGTATQTYLRGGRYVRNLAFFEFVDDDHHDYIVWIGDSISELCARHHEAQTLLKQTHNRDVCLFNEAVAGWNVGDVESALATILARHPHAKHCVLMIGTNNVTPLRPYTGTSQAALDAVQATLLNIIHTIQGAGITLHMARIPYANYTLAPAVNGTANEENGSRPFNERFHDKLIAQYCGHLFDGTKGILDSYTFLRNNLHLLTDDSSGIHPYHYGGRLLGRYLLTRLGSALWGKYLATTPDDSLSLGYPGAKHHVRISFGPVWAVSSVAQSIYNRTLAGLYDSVEGIVWNNIQGTTTGTTSGLINVEGERTPISITITTAFSGNTGNNVANVVTSGDDLPYIEAAKLSFAYTNSGVTASMTIGGLAPASSYKFTIFGSHDGTAAEVVTYAETVNGVSTTLDVRDNLSNLVTLTGLSPNGSGQLVFTVTRAGNIGYINVLEIVRE